MSINLLVDRHTSPGDDASPSQLLNAQQLVHLVHVVVSVELPAHALLGDDLVCGTWCLVAHNHLLLQATLAIQAASPTGLVKALNLTVVTRPPARSPRRSLMYR